MAKCVGSVSYCAPYELISTDQALEFRDLKELPLKVQKCCQVSTESQRCRVDSAADTTQQLARLQKHLKKSKVFSRKAFHICKKQAQILRWRSETPSFVTSKVLLL